MTQTIVKKPMVTCPGCHGSGQMELTVQDHGKPATTSMITCLDCEGSGLVSQAALEARQREIERWCRCDEYPEDTVYRADGQCPPPCYHKHHWHCGTCGKVLQLG